MMNDSSSRKKKHLEFDQLGTLRERFDGKKIVHCHGVFDLLHAGHLSYLEAAKKLGDLLVVTVTADQFVNKGPGRPYFTAHVRASMLAALEIIDFVAISDNPLAVAVINQLRPHFYVKGPDYKDRSADVTGGITQEENVVQRHGGQLVFTSEETFSSSTLLNKFFSTWSDEQARAIEAIRDAGGFEVIEQVLEKLAKETVLIVGEPIIDTYTFCLPEAISSKSPTVSAKFQYEENYAGGSLANANHLADLVKDVTLLMTHGSEKYFEDLLAQKIDRRVRVVSQTLANIPIPRKIRYISVDKAQRIFEITDLRSDQWMHHPPKEFCQQLEKHHENCTATILADFGHGLFEGPVLDTVAKMKGFIGLNVQTNSSNFGFNPFTKHRNFSFLSIDTKEVRLAYHDRYASPLDLARRCRKDLQKLNATLAMTLGPNGAYYFPKDLGQEFHSPAFADSVVDATGAGDAFFALTSMLVKVGCPDIMVPFLGNIYAGLKTRIIGNKSSVTRAQLIKAVGSILK